MRRTLCTRIELRLLLISVYFCIAYNNGPMTARPPLGWQTWCAVGKCGTDYCSDVQIRESIIALNATGMKDKGYVWVVLDDCWHPSRGSDGKLVADSARFPDGIKPTADFAHSQGFKFGLYSSIGNETCHGGWSPGSFGYYETDAETFADWGIDYVKMDWCGEDRYASGHVNFSKALNATGRPMVLELCRGNYRKEKGWGYAPSIAQLWRAADDHHDNFQSTLKQIAILELRPEWSGPYGWAYGDMLMTGGQGCDQYNASVPTHCPGQTDEEYRTEITLYAMLSSPLLLGTDVRNFTRIMAQTLLNDDLLFVDQDAHAPPAYIDRSCGNRAYIRHLTDGRIALAIPNLSLTGEYRTLGVCLDDINLAEAFGPVIALKDVWLNSTEVYTVDGEYKRSIAPNDILFLILDPRK